MKHSEETFLWIHINTKKNPKITEVFVAFPEKQLH